MPWEIVIALYIGVAVAIGVVLLRRALQHTPLRLDALCLAAAWAYAVGGALWLRAWLVGQPFLGFEAPWTWLTAVHFHAAGLGSWSVSALAARFVGDVRRYRIMAGVLLAHPVAFSLVAAGINGAAGVDIAGACFYWLLYAVQLIAVAPALPRRRASHALRIALAVPLVMLLPSIAWSLGTPLLGFDKMIVFHGLVNVAGHVALGLGALLVLRPAVRGASSARA